MTIASERKADCVGIRTNIVRIPEILSSLPERVVSVEVKYVKRIGHNSTWEGKFICMLTYLYPNCPLPSIWKRWLVCKDTVSGDKGGSPQAPQSLVFDHGVGVSMLWHGHLELNKNRVSSSRRLLLSGEGQG